jgi:hypothetical protein
MNAQTEKLELIEWLIHLEDMDLLSYLKSLKEASEATSTDPKPLSIEELIARAEASNLAIEEGRVSDVESVIDENWD